PVEASSAVLRAAETPRETGLSISMRVRRSDLSPTTPAVSSVDPSLTTMTSRSPASKFWLTRLVRLPPMVASAFFAAMTTLTTGAGIGSFLRPDAADGRRVRGFRELARLGCGARPTDRRGGRRTESGEQGYASVQSCSLGVLPPASTLIHPSVSDPWGESGSRKMSTNGQGSSSRSLTSLIPLFSSRRPPPRAPVFTPARADRSCQRTLGRAQRGLPQTSEFLGPWPVSGQI